MKVDAGITSNLDNAGHEAQALEELGYDGLKSIETAHDPFFPLLLAAQRTKSVDLITNLEVDKERMLQNIEITNGLIYAERVSLHLSKTIGKMQAHESVKKACALAIQQQRHLKEVVLEIHPEIANIEVLFEPISAIGNSLVWVENILKKYS